eukprot:TRINITY_DN634_c0_g1_i1.p1 TRINITY_DN634_c0_g1~~TRINITY_DN634_c0_g1_i1.p1  ORF type:complete len:303 (-),score=47.93 TRINITY_DN634_c0_g1_i1:829-1737(-)
MWNFVVCFLCILQVLCQDTILQNPANSKVTSEDTILSNPNLTPTTLSNGKVEQVSSAPVPENEMAAGEDLSQNTTPFNPQDMVLSNPSATSQDTTLSNPTPAPMDMVLSNPAATSQDTTLSNAPMDIILSNPAATTQDTVISNQIIPSQLDTLISNPNVAPPASANSTAQDSSISNIAATPPFQGSATTGNNVKLDGRTSLSGPVTSSASASCENTKNECVCKSQWLFALGSGIVHEGCANPDEDPAGLWCVIDQKSCSVLNPNLFQMLDSRRDPVDWFGTTEYIDYCNPRCAQSSMGKRGN